MAYIVEEIRLSDLRRALPVRLYYGSRTCWWTDDAAHLSLRYDGSGLPCDPLGGMLTETSDVEEFLTAAEANPTQFGWHGLRAFMAAHHLNCRASYDDPRPVCLRTWDEYNNALEAQNASSPLKYSNASFPRPCDAEIYENGCPVFISQSLPADVMEQWVKKVAARSGQPIDWHLHQGRARVLALGDFQAIHAAIREFLPEYDDLQQEAMQAKGLPFYPSYEFPSR